jgi:branched-chain amino acid aminotransferase
MKVCINGKIVTAKDAKISVFDAAFTSGYGFYETLFAENGEVNDLDEHIDRLFESANLLGVKKPCTRNDAKKWVAKVVPKKGLFRVRITVSFGSDEPQVVIFALPMKPFDKKFFNVVTYKIERVLPEVKTTSLLPQYLARREMTLLKADEVLLVNHRGEITEGSVTNVFFVKDGELITPKKEILKGTMRQNAIEVAKKLGIKVRKRAVKKSELKDFQECFVTNSLMFVVPVLSIDDKKISGKIGPLTKKIRNYVCKKS